MENLFGVPFTRFRELIDSFMEAGYDLKNDEHFKFIKRDYFKKLEKKNG